MFIYIYICMKNKTSNKKSVLLKKKLKKSQKKYDKKNKTNRKIRIHGGMENNEKNQCSICLDTDGTKIVSSCNHTFHQECIANWCKITNIHNCTCPICRKEFDDDDKVLMGFYEEVIKRKITKWIMYHIENIRIKIDDNIKPSIPEKWAIKLQKKIGTYREDGPIKKIVNMLLIFINKFDKDFLQIIRTIDSVNIKDAIDYIRKISIEQLYTFLCKYLDKYTRCFDDDRDYHDNVLYDKITVFIEGAFELVDDITEPNKTDPNFNLNEYIRHILDLPLHSRNNSLTQSE